MFKSVAGICKQDIWDAENNLQQMDEFLNKFQNVMKFLGYTEVTVSSCDLIKGLNLSCEDNTSTPTDFCGETNA